MYPEKDIFDVGGFPVVKGRTLVEALLEQAAAGSPRVLGEQAVDLRTSEEGPVWVTTATGRVIEARR